MSSINFDNPWLLLVAVPLLILLLLPFFLTVRKDNRSGQNVISCILHILIAACIAFAVAGPTIKTINQQINVYIVADLSYSTNQKVDEIDGHIRYVESHLPENAEMGVICFGGKDAQDLNTRMGEPFYSVRQSLGEGKLDAAATSSTDIPSALRRARSLFRAGVVERIVLITDAKNSDMSDENILRSTVLDLTAEGIYVDAIYLDSNISETAKEVQISSAEYTDEVYLEQSSNVRVYLQSASETQRTLKLTRTYEGAEGKVTEVVDQRMVALSVGLNGVTLKLNTQQKGVFFYEVTIEETEEDESLLNNRYTFTQTVAEKPNMLFITDSGAVSAQSDIRSLCGEDYGKVDVINIDLQYLPLTVKELCAYDEIVLSDVRLNEAPNYALFIDSLHTVVTQLGKSLIGLGDLGLHGTADESLLKLAGMLPVTYGNPKKDTVQYAIVLDRSLSMERDFKENRWRLAKDAAKQLVDVIAENPSNKLSLITFYDESEVTKSAIEHTVADEVKTKIDELTLEHGTSMMGGLDWVDTELGLTMDEAFTQVFLITDCQSASSEASQLKARLKAWQAKGVKVTVMAIAPDDASETAIQERCLISQDGDGNVISLGDYRKIEDYGSLSDVFAEFVEEEDKETLVDIPAYLTKNKINDSVLTNIEDKAYTREGGKGYIWGYVRGRAKASATVVLTQRDGEINSNLPIYAYWNCGNGKAASFLTNFSPDAVENENDHTMVTRDGTSKWRNVTLENGNTLWEQFFSNVFSCNIPSRRTSVPFQISSTKKEGSATLELRPAMLQAGVRVDVVLTDPLGNKTEFNNVALSGSVYTCSFALPTVGEYVAEIRYTYQGVTETAVHYIHLPYLAEYDRFTNFEPSPLYKMLSGRGTVSEDGKLEIVNDESKVGTKIMDLTPISLIAAIALLMVDIVVRKVKWVDIKNLFSRRNKGGRV